MKIQIKDEELVTKRVTKYLILLVTLDNGKELKLGVSMWLTINNYFNGIDESDWEFIEDYDLDEYDKLDDDIKDKIFDFINELYTDL